MSNSETGIRKIKDKLLHHTKLLSDYLMKIKLSHVDAELNIGLVKREVQTLLKELSLLSGNYNEGTNATINALIEKGTRIARHRERNSILSDLQQFDDWISGINILNLIKPTILDHEQDQKLKLVNDRFEDYLTKLRPWKVVKRIFLALSFILTVILLVSQIIVIKYPSFSFPILMDRISLYLFAISFFIYFISDEYYKYLEKRHRLSNTDLLYVYTGRISSLLDGYIENRSLNEKNNAIELMEKIIDLVNKWYYGNITFIRNQFGVTIDLFKENFSSKTLGVINAGNDDDLKLLFDALSDFQSYLISPSIKDLISINELMEPLPEIEFIPFSNSDRVKIYLYNRPNIIRIVPAIGASLFFSYYSFMEWEWSVKEIIPVVILLFVSIYAQADKLFSIEKRKSDIESKAHSAGINFNR